MNDVKCDDCPVEGFKVIKKMLWGVISTLGTLIVIGATALVDVNSDVDDNTVEDVRVHTQHEQRIKTTEKAVEKITDTLEEQTDAFHDMKEIMIKLEGKIRE